ncbi:hypothetical protein [Candidatus Aalborgicola defluviihabitans]|uniref:hypothetical protein n=1 Tax=Candidatus Aalborgicola defluviihabitans TaxID=3386187 RepID=UPI001D2AD802|nr:hypothetical protein [Burkholderiales bacterium]MBK6567232.1 hypothetical protein [Burkholderiales bacterium]MBK7314689.1 hypothetical protein [Burkholderiales bacterium]MBL0245443.1 hypothetical protein [Rhodoferax sp.]
MTIMFTVSSIPLLNLQASGFDNFSGFALQAASATVTQQRLPPNQLSDQINMHYISLFMQNNAFSFY